MRVEPPTSTTSSIFDGVHAGVGQRLPRRRDRALQQVVHQLLEPGPGEPLLQVLRPGRVGADERQVDVGLHHRGELHLGLLRRLAQALERHAILRQIDALGLLELGHDPLDDPVIEVVAAQMRVAVGGLHLHHALAHLEDRDVERAAAEVVHGDRLVLLLVEAVGQRRRRGLVDDAHHLEAGDLAGLLGGLALRVVEVRGHRDHRARHRLTQVLLGRLLELLEHHRRDLRRRVVLVPDLDADVAVGRGNDGVGDHLHLLAHLVEAAAHEALDREHGVLGVRDRLALGDLPDEALARLGERHDRRRQPAALGIGDDDGLPAFDDGNDGVGGAQVDSDDFAHELLAASGTVRAVV